MQRTSVQAQIMMRDRIASPSPRRTSESSSRSRSGSRADRRSIHRRSNCSFELPRNDNVANSRPVKVTDQDLHIRIHEANEQIDFRTLTNLSLCRWQWQRSKNDLTTFTRLTRSSEESSTQHQSPEVLVAGRISCNMDELLRIFRVRTQDEHNRMLTQLYGKKRFIHGALVHVVSPPSTINSDPNDCVSVKTALFVGSTKILSVKKNEQWCYLERCQASTDKNTLHITITTLDEHELATGKAPVDRVNQLQGLTLAYLFEKVPGMHNTVQVLFHGRFGNERLHSSRYRRRNHKNTNKVSYTSTKATTACLLMFAKAVTKLPDLVREHRLGLQSVIDRSSDVFPAFPAPIDAKKNSQCTCCTRRLNWFFLFSRKKQCVLCGYYVCDRCWSVRKREIIGGNNVGHQRPSVNDGHRRLQPIVVCTRCLNCTDCCDYTYSDGEASPSASSSRSPHHRKSLRKSNDHQLVHFLQNVLEKDSTKRKGAMTVVKHLIRDKDQDDLPPRNSDWFSSSPSSSPSSSSSASPSSSSSHRKRTDSQLLDTLEKSLNSPLASKAFVFANPQKRPYPIDVPANPLIETPKFPVPRNENSRLRAIRKSHVLDLRDQNGELEILCGMAARELRCAYGLVTMLEQDKQVILAANVEQLQHVELPRNHTFCQHLVMDDRPLLVRHPESDMRFYNIDPVVKMGIRFYCGFPIKAVDGSIIGSICCLDAKPREITRIQYARMKKLAATAARIIHLECQKLNRSKRLPPAA